MPKSLHIASRVAASLLGGWAFVWGFTALAIAGQVAAGRPFNEAHTAAMLLAFLLFLSVFCWSFATASLLRVWAVLAGGALVMTAAAWWLQSSLV
ncbi:MAG: iron uptake protein [Rubrivivax sp.]